MNENQSTINGRVFSTGWLPPEKAIDVEMALVTLLGPALFKTLSSKSADPSEAGALAIVALAQGVDSEKIKPVLKTLHACVTIDGKFVQFEEAYSQGRHRDVWQMALFVLKYNFADFLPGGLLAALKAKVAQALKPSNSSTSTGTAGDQ